MSENVQTLTGVEATALDDLEGVIAKGMATFVEVGRALERIRDRRLYRETHSTFESYCKERWGISRGHAYRQIDGAQVVSVLQDSGTEPKMSTRLGDVRLQVGDIPASESVARELAPLKAEPEQVQQAWQEAVQEHGPKPTAEQVRRVVRRKTNVKPKPARASKREVEALAGTVWTRARALERSVAKLASASGQRPDVEIPYRHDLLRVHRALGDLLAKAAPSAEDCDKSAPADSDLPGAWTLDDLEAIAAQDADS